MQPSAIRALLFTLVLLSALSARAIEPARKPFQPPGMWIWDNWFVHEGGQWHAFYLELPKAVGPERRWKDNDPYKHVGHAVSKNLVDWQNVGPALCALSGTWNDRHIATGSVIRHEGKWWMFFTGRGKQGDGVGLAVSDDLTTWEGETWRWVGISDPYIYPEPVEGCFYVVLCSRILDVPVEESGSLTLMRSRDLHHWEPAGIIAWPHCFERMETPQLWPRQGRWYLSFGGVLSMPWAEQNQERLPAAARGRRSHKNYCYALPNFLQPARNEDLHFIAAPSGSYIMKVLTQAADSDVALFSSTDERGTCLSLPLKVRYLPDGGLELE